ncbi:hypothetical protein [Fulvivirga lutea]|uniref:Uncharacterized protein n=1 Tax=Fulvivirga lutea TaxID=2810512 RepID=A0A974WDW5_9BACT|nr:hypothetical protein [Fulvivirga lutea]QSE95895.1 hypothetical protein JR347_09705 [Fulvivirga lutea]
MDVLAIILYLFVFALLITAISGLAFKTHGPWGSYWPSFLLTFLFIWVVSLWTEPVGPVYYGVSWVPIIFAGVIMAILLAAVTPPQLRRQRKIILKDNKEDRNPGTAIALGILFWVVIIILIVGIIAKYTV